MGPDGVRRDYTSARLTTQGHFSQEYGRFEARIQVPSGKGVWPAFLLMGDDLSTAGWPACGEIDIMEYRKGTERHPRKPSWSLAFVHANIIHQHALQRSHLTAASLSPILCRGTETRSSFGPTKVYLIRSQRRCS